MLLPPGFLLNLIYTIHRKGIVCSGIRNKNKKHGSNLIVSVTGLPALDYSVWRSRLLALVSWWWMQKNCHIWYLVLHAFSLIMPYMKYQLIPAKIRFLVHRIFFCYLEALWKDILCFLWYTMRSQSRKVREISNSCFTCIFVFTSINVGILRRVTHFRHFSYRGTIYSFTAFRYFHKLRSSTFCPIEYNILFCNVRKFFCFAIRLLRT